MPCIQTLVILMNGNQSGWNFVVIVNEGSNEADIYYEFVGESNASEYWHVFLILLLGCWCYRNNRCCFKEKGSTLQSKQPAQHGHP